MTAPAARAVDAGAEPPSEGAKRRPLVVMKQVEVKGAVFYLSDDEGEEAPASNVEIKARTLDGGTVLHQTVTDADGRYALPNLAAGTYDFLVGQLRLELRVLDPEQNGAGRRRIPKTILVFIPRSLGEEERGR
jgi:5-hydroxyisourate hydrolase-like protein (transthyretin family)